MASGYEKSPDYGGPEPTVWGTILRVLLICGVAGLIVYWRKHFF
jgi:hypothetical protein